MTFLHLQYFLEVYQYQNFSRAAEHIHVARQSLSKAIGDLEEEFGEVFFQRTQNGLIPTDAGDDFYRHARNMLAEYEAMHRTKTVNQIRKKQLTIYSMDAVMPLLTCDFFQEFHRLHPDIVLSFQETTDEDAKNRLEVGKCDFAIVSGAVDMSQFQRTFLFLADYVALLSEKNPLAQKEMLSMEDLSGENLLGKSPELRYYERDINWRLHSGADYKFVFESNCLPIKEEMVRRNEGVMLTWDYTAISRQPVEGCVFRQLYQEDFGVNVYLLENPKVHRSADCEIFRDFLLQWISSRLEGPPWAEKNDGVY